MKQLVTILLDNAFKYSDAKGVYNHIPYPFLQN